MFNGYRVSILDDEKVLEINDKFYVILLPHTKKKISYRSRKLEEQRHTPPPNFTLNSIPCIN